MQARQGKFSIHETLIQIAKHNHKGYVHLFEQREYGKILRNAAYKLDVELVALMLRIRDQIGLDVNGQSPSNNNTALDWALETRSDHQDLMIRVTGMLVDAGGKTQDQLQDEELVDSAGYEAGDECVSDANSEEECRNYTGCVPF